MLLAIMMLISSLTNVQTAQATTIEYVTGGYTLYETIDGEVWCADHTTNATNVTIVFDTKGTSSIYDDEILFCYT